MRVSNYPEYKAYLRLNQPVGPGGTLCASGCEILPWIFLACSYSASAHLCFTESNTT